MFARDRELLHRRGDAVLERIGATDELHVERSQRLDVPASHSAETDDSSFHAVSVP